MDKTRILQQGEEAKFQIAIKDFDMSANNFSLKLIYGYRRTVIDIQKDKMFDDGAGKWYFVFDTDDMVGRVTALCTWRVPDTDCPDGYREETDEQYLCFVVSTPCPQFLSCPCDDSSRPVKYTRTETSGVAGRYAYLACADYDRILTCDNEIILVLKEGQDVEPQDNDEESNEESNNQNNE